jgi:hypothetical protein
VPEAGVRPLSELELVDWARLGHRCSGPSLPQIPELVRALVSGADDAEDELWNTVLHQGQTGEVTGHVLPFVFGILLEHPQRRLQFCDWLVQTSWVFEHERADGESTRAAWRNAATALLPLLDDHEPEVRTTAAGTMSAVDDLDQGVWLAIRHRLGQEPDPLVTNDLRYALVRAARSAQAKAESADLSREWFRDSNPLVRAAGAHALLWLNPAQTDARHHLASLLPDGLSSSTAFFGLASATTITEDLARGGLDADADGVLPAVLDSLGSNGFLGDADVIPYILDSLFGPQGSIPPPSLTAAQALTLRRIAELPLTERRGVATVVSSTCYELRVRGLPDEPETLRTFADR